MSVKGFVCALSPERRRLLLEEPRLADDIADREVDVPGRIFFDSARISRRLAKRLPDAARVLVDFLERRVGETIGDDEGFRHGRPRVVSREDLDRMMRAFEVLADAPRAVAGDEIETDAQMVDAFLARLAILVALARARAEALLVHAV